MFSNDFLIELTFNYFYVIFEYYSFIELKLNPYKFFLDCLFIKYCYVDFPKYPPRYFSKPSFCWVLTCLHHIYWISVN